VREALEAAWKRRTRLLEQYEALRVFHGPGEGQGPLANLAIERFGLHFWVTCWSESWPELEPICTEFLESKRAHSAVVVRRLKGGVAEIAAPFLGDPPADGAWIHENRLRYLIRFRETRHPGLFLDHEPLRAWLSENARGWKVLNAFAYTGSLSVAAAVGGAAHVTTLDLSKPSIAWAQGNWIGNELSEERARFISGDVFDWLPRLKKKKEQYDCVILDPPSFARGPKGAFSTEKDLVRLHELAFGILKKGGTLVSSINSANVPPEKFHADVSQAARASQRKLELVQEIKLPESFPARTAEESYLKGGIYRC
jgi:23S rRNA (cytosine1962-C5)-methyltransferase